MNYPMFSNNNPMYMQNLQSLQDMRDRIDNQIKSYQQTQMQQPQIPQVTQNFQITPQTNNSEIQAKYVTNINDVKNTFVMTTGIFVNKEMNTLWLKNINGDIRTFNLQEIIEQDPKDIEIQNLRNEIERMKGMIFNANESVNADIDESITSSKPKGVSNSKRTNAK